MDTQQPVHAATDWHALDTQQALDSLGSNPTGLAEGEILSRRQRYGANRLPPPRRRGPLLRLLRVKNFVVEEAALTGESVPVEKSIARAATDAVLGDRRCMAYSGTLVSSGQALGLVVATGPATELGRIGSMLQQVQPLTTPLLRQIDGFSRWLSVALLALAIVTFALGTLWREQDPEQMFMMVVALTVAAIPEGLPAIMTVILALGVQRMARQNAIVRHLPAVETLGSVTGICTDKTGTLTRNEMTVQRLVCADRIIDVSGAGYAPAGGFHIAGGSLDIDQPLLEIGRAALLCNDARLEEDAAGRSEEHTSE